MFFWLMLSWNILYHCFVIMEFEMYSFLHIFVYIITHMVMWSVFRLLGFDKLLNFIVNEWLQDIKKNQLQSLLGGIGPMHAVVQLCKCRSISLMIMSMWAVVKNICARFGVLTAVLLRIQFFWDVILWHCMFLAFWRIILHSKHWKSLAHWYSVMS